MTERERLADEMEDVLLHRTLGAWFPRCVEDAGPLGGFHERYDRAWGALPDPTRSLVFAARMTWVCATMAEGGFPGEWRTWAVRGVEHLRGRFHAGGGRFHWRIDPEGRPVGVHAGESVLYGHAFAMFALAAAARTVPQSGAGELAHAAFAWYESAHRDPEFPGSFEIVGADGAAALEREGSDELGTPYGTKSQNSPLHLLEALAELFEVAPTPEVEARLRETIRLMTDTMFRTASDGGGCLEHQIRREGSPVPAPATFGHDVEAGHLVLAALARLPGEDEWTPTARERARGLIRTALSEGFANGSLGASAGDARRVSWVQSENLLALATMVADGSEELMDDLAAQWAWFRDRQVDAEHGGLFGTLSPEGEPLGDAAKGGPWKAAYHDTRALLYSARLLRGARVGEDPDRDAPRGY